MRLPKLSSLMVMPLMVVVTSAVVLDAPLGYSSKARVWAQTTDGASKEAERLLDLCRAHLAQEQAEAAIQSCQEARAAYQTMGERSGEAKSTINLGNAYDSLGQYQQAIDLYQQSLAIKREIGDRKGEANSLNNLGNTYFTLGQYQQAIDYYQQSLVIAREIGDRKGEANSLRNLGLAYNSLGQYQQAIDFHQQSLAIAREIGDRKGEANSLGNLGLAYFTLGQYQQAIDFHQQSLAIARELGDRQVEAKSLNFLGITYDVQGQHQQAIDFHQQSLAIARELGYRLGEASSLNNLGNAHYLLGQYQQAIDFYQQSLAIARELGDRKGEAQSLGNLGLAYDALGQYQQAIDFHQQYLETSRGLGHRLGEAQSLGNLGVAYDALGQYQQAIDFYQQSLAIARELGDREGEGRSLSDIGDTLDKLEQPDLAINFLKQSVNVREGIRTDIQSLTRDLQESYTETVAGTYRKLADLLIARGRIPEAQQVLELLKIQELNDFSQGTRSPDKLSQIALNPAETQIKAEHGTLIAFGRKFYDCEQTSCTQLESLRTQYKALDKAFYQLATEITQQVEANRQQQVAIGTDDFQASADRVVTAHENAVLIYPLVLPDKVRLLWAAKGGVLADEVCTLTEADLNRTVAEFQTLLRTPTSDMAQVKTVGKQLYDCLIKPLEPELKANGIQHLIFAPDRATHYIPFGALYDGEQFLIQRYRINNILSAKLTNTETRLPATAQQVSVLGLGLSDAHPGFNPLPHVSTELDTLVRTGADDPLGVYSGSAFLNQAFNLSALENNLAGRQIVHIATHGEFVPANPRDSYLLLGTGEKYSIPDIQTLRQLRQVHLVVLSACETALSGADSNGIEVAGMSSYFLDDKAKAVLASLWKVNDASTSQLMQQFYQNLATGKMSKAEALRQAQIALITGSASANGSDRATILATGKRTGQPAVGSTQLSHPYYWAPFILIGNGL